MAKAKKKTKSVKAWAVWCINNKKDGPWIEASTKRHTYPGEFRCTLVYNRVK